MSLATADGSAEQTSLAGKHDSFRSGDRPLRRIAVIGLGRFGMALARNLARLGVQVIAIDRNMQLVNEIKDDVDLAVRLDSTDLAALDAQDIDKVDVCVVAVG